MFEDIDKILPLINNLSLDKRYIVFGTGKAATILKMLLNSLDIKVAYFVDNDKKKWYSNFFSHTILPPSTLLNEEKDNITIIIASMYYREISDQLSGMGYEKELHYLSFLEDKTDYSTTENRVINGVPVGKFSYGYKKHCWTGTLLESIGSFCSINESVKIGEFNHPLNSITTHPILYTASSQILGYEGVPGILSHDDIMDIYTYEKNKKIKIGNDVWIGANAVILPSVTVGNGAVIGAGAIVTRDVPDYAIVAGVPAKVIRSRFNDDQIRVLNKVKWWDWEVEKIIENAHLLKDPDKFFLCFSD